MLSLLILTATLAPDLQEAYPADPFSKNYRVPQREEVGTGAGQMRFIGLFGIAAKDNIEILAQGTVEPMGTPFLGVRLTSAVALYHPEVPHILSFRAGPSLHLLPYRAFDISLYAEGGLTLVDIGSSNRTVMPEITTGMAFDVAFGSYWFLRIEGRVAYGVASRDGRAEERVRGVGLLGLGTIL